MKKPADPLFPNDVTVPEADPRVNIFYFNKFKLIRAGCWVNYYCYSESHLTLHGRVINLFQDKITLFSVPYQVPFTVVLSNSRLTARLSLEFSPTIDPAT